MFVNVSNGKKSGSETPLVSFVLVKDHYYVEPVDSVKGNGLWYIYIQIEYEYTMRIELEKILGTIDIFIVNLNFGIDMDRKAMRETGMCRALAAGVLIVIS